MRHGCVRLEPVLKAPITLPFSIQLKRPSFAHRRTVHGSMFKARATSLMLSKYSCLGTRTALIEVERSISLLWIVEHGISDPMRTNHLRKQAQRLLVDHPTALRVSAILSRGRVARVRVHGQVPPLLEESRDADHVEPVDQIVSPFRP